MLCFCFSEYCLDFIRFPSLWYIAHLFLYVTCVPPPRDFNVLSIFTWVLMIIFVPLSFSRKLYNGKPKTKSTEIIGYLVLGTIVHVLVFQHSLVGEIMSAVATLIELWLFFLGTRVEFPASTWGLITFCTSISRENNALFWPLQHQETMGCTDIRVGKIFTHIRCIFKKSFK